jgi:hypothetical protein
VTSEHATLMGKQHQTYTKNERPVQLAGKTADADADLLLKKNIIISLKRYG